MMRFRCLRGWAILGVFLALTLGCSGGGGSSHGSDAAGAVRSFYDHLNAGRYDDAKALYTDETRAQIFPDADADEGFQNWAVVETHKSSMSELTIVSETESDEGVTIEFELRFDSGETSQRRVTVTEENGGWKLGFIG